jgi:hypothetical protein
MAPRIGEDFVASQPSITVIDGEAEGDLGRQLAALQTPDAATGIGDGILGDRARRDPCRYAERGAADSR